MNNALVLIVDDVDENLFLLDRILTSRNYRTAMASGGKQALEFINEEPPDLILLDIMMPDMDGFEVCRLLKEDPQNRDIPVIFLTGKTASEDIIQGLELGAADYITKPFRHAELLLRVKTQVDLQLGRKELQRKNRDLRQMNASKDKLVSIISHDLKSPFQGLMGLTEILHREAYTISRDDIHEFTEKINESARYLVDLLGNLLDWYMLERTLKSYSPGRIILEELVRKTLSLFSATLTSKSINVHNRLTGSEVIWADSKMIETIIRNLVSNAVKFTPENGEIRITAEERDKEVILSITDTGIGMSEEIRQSLFQIDTTATRPGTHQEKGTGLGLIICKQLAEANNGTLRINSKPDEGTTVSIIFPVGSKSGQDPPE